MVQPKHKKFVYDPWILGSALALVAIGLVMVGSASMVISDKTYGFPFYHLIHQAGYILVSALVGLITTRIPLSKVQSWGGPALLACMGLLILVLIPGIGSTVNGSTRWIRIPGFSLQVSELVKLFVFIYLSGYLVRHQRVVETRLGGFMRPMVVLVIISGLLLLEPDFGAVAVIMTTSLLMIFIAGVRLGHFACLFSIVAVAMGLLIFLEPYRLERLLAFLHPWANQFGSGYQLTQSLIALGRGGVLGVGLGNSIQKLFYLPEAHTDFLFAILAEELGLIGEVIVVALFVILVGRALILAQKALKRKKPFAAYLAYGLGLWLALQAFVNIGVNTGLLPTKGLTLPLMSYGGSSLLVSGLLVALLLRISYEVDYSGAQSAKKRR